MESKHLTIDVLNRDGFVILDHPEFRFDLLPEEAKILAEFLIKHAGFASADRDARIARTKGGK
jgi:hypothetical protein